MLFRQFTHDDLGCASCLIGDDDAGIAAVVDPRFEIDVYLDLARYMDVVLVGRDDADALRAARLATAVGIRKLAGFLHGGMTSWREEEWDKEHIPGSTHTPYHDINAIPEWIDPGRPVAAVCASGQRAAVAASLLARYGAEHVVHVTSGGVGHWERAGRPVEHSG